MLRFNKRDLTPDQEARLKEKFLDALTFNCGLEFESCKAVGITHYTYKSWFDKDQFFRERVFEIKEAAIDFVESKFLQNIRANDQRAIEFYLKKKAKHRGYGDDLSDKIEEGAKIMGWTVVPVKPKEIKE